MTPWFDDTTSGSDVYHGLVLERRRRQPPWPGNLLMMMCSLNVLNPQGELAYHQQRPHYTLASLPSAVNNNTLARVPDTATQYGERYKVVRVGQGLSHYGHASAVARPGTGDQHDNGQAAVQASSFNR